MREPFRQLKAEAELVHRLYGDGPHHGGLSVRQIAAKLGRTYGWTWRRWRWWADMQEAHSGFLVRANRLPMRGSRNWDTADFEWRVAARQKIAATIKAKETIGRADKSRRAAAEAARNAEKARRDEADEWVTSGSDPSKAPAWLIETLTGEKGFPPGPGVPAQPER
jgi:hypothetical protein